MGACISMNAKPLTKSNKTEAPFDSESTRPRPKTRFSRMINVVTESSGNDIYAHYEFGKELGRGEFGITYACIYRQTGEKMACKKISKSKLKSEIDVEDVRREVEIMRHLPPHPNIVRYKDVFEDKEAVYLVMELCKGGELFDRIVSRGHYTERGAATVTKTILEIIQVCHNHGVIHRDLKPENFLYADSCEDCPLKAIDFGLSMFFKEGQQFKEIVGSPYYMAPEVLRRNYGPEVDVWSAGVILYILLCGVPPFWADSEEGIAQAIVRCEVDFKRDPWPKVSEKAKDLVRGMLDPNPHSQHSWIHDAHLVPNISLGNNVRTRIKQFSLMNKFKKKVLSVVADNLTREQVAGIKQMFEMMDTDKNGNLCFQELKDGLDKIGHPVPDHDVQLLIDAADLDGNGLIDCEEFTTMSVHLKKMSNDDEQLRRAFQYFDKDRSGYIEFEELRQGLFEEDEDNRSPHNDKIISDIIFDIDLDKDGRISYEEFEAMMTTGVEWRMASRQYSRAMLNALSQRLFKD